ncbi:MAG TPA: hypothetical protein VHD62_17750 [Opitutaceae bacterium]|nr:hypothetical protein [Opitutaceae bacterium]
MTLVLLLLAGVQAALLLWASIHLANAFLRPAKTAALLNAGLALVGALVIARYGARLDLHRILPGAGDCLMLIGAVACVRVFAVTREAEKLAEERAFAAQEAAAAAEAARRAEEEDRIRAAAAQLDASTAEAAAKISAPPSSAATAPTETVEPPPRPPAAPVVALSSALAEPAPAAPLRRNPRPPQPQPEAPA